MFYAKALYNLEIELFDCILAIDNKDTLQSVSMRFLSACGSCQTFLQLS